MKFLVVLSLVASAFASPIAVKTEVAEATSYLADAEDVAAAKAEFEKLFKAAEAGTPIIPALPAAPVVQTALPANYYGLGGYFGYPYAGYNGLYGGYYNGIHGAYGYPYNYGLTGYPLNYLPFQLTAPAAVEAKSE